MTANTFKQIARANIVLSKTNPRKHFNQDELRELAASIAEKGIIEPLIVRPKSKSQFELVVGERRYRAAAIAHVTDFPCVVRELSDQAAMDIQIIENLQRKDLTPLEEATAFRALIKSQPDKHSAGSIAARVGKSASWVWDVMKLLDLVPEARKLLDEGRISVNHAIPIARLTPEQQKRVIDPDHGGLFVYEHARHLDFEGNGKEKKTGKYNELKAVSVRELNQWLNDHVRFDAKRAAQAAPLEFEPVTERLEEAAARPGRGKKVIAITREHFVQRSARDQSERTFGPRSWKRADGIKQTTEQGYPPKWIDSPRCEHSVMGCVVVGQGQGEAFEVCIARDRCRVHWGKEIREKAKRQNLRDSGKTAAAESKREAQEQRHRDQEQQREERWKVFGPALKKATFAALDKLPANLPKPLYQKLLTSLQLPKDTKAAELARAIVRRDVRDQFSWLGQYHEPEMISWAKALGVDVKGCEPKSSKEQ